MANSVLLGFKAARGRCASAEDSSLMPAAARRAPPGAAWDQPRIINNMPSFPFSQLVDVEDALCQVVISS